MSNTEGQFGHFGQEGYNSANSEYNAISFIVMSLLGSFVSTMKIVKVKSVTNEGALAAVGFVDVQPMVNLMNGVGETSEHGTIFNVPYFRLQGGKNAVIVDPAVDDIGIMVCADRDSSVVKESKAVSQPGSQRRFSMADGVYIGGILNGTPEQFIRFHEDGIEIKSTNGKISLNGLLINKDGQVDGNLNVQGDVQAAGEVSAKTATPQQIRLTTHFHPSNGAPPTPGS